MTSVKPQLLKPAVTKEIMSAAAIKKLESKIDHLMHSIESIIDRLSSVDQKLDDFNDRFDQLDKKFTNNCEELEATLVSKASTERLHELVVVVSFISAPSK